MFSEAIIFVLVLAILLTAIIAPFVIRRILDDRHSRKLIDRNARTLHRHYEAADDARQMQKLPAEFRSPDSLIFVEFALHFEGPGALSDAQRAWGEVERLGFGVRTERTKPSTVVMLASTTLAGGDPAALTHLHLRLEHVARAHGGAYAGWNATLAKRAG